MDQIKNMIFEELFKTYTTEYSSSETTSDFSDEELFNLNYKKKLQRNRVKIKNFIESVVHKYSDQEFVRHFRLKRSTTYKLIERLKNSDILPKHSDGREKISAEKSFLLTLWYLGNMETYRQIEDRFDVSPGSVILVLKRVIKFLFSIKSEVIKWPAQKEAENIARGFKNMKGLPDVIGSIDGSHIEIPKPMKDQDAYCNRKGYHSLLLQGVVDCKKKFIDVFCGEAGSMNDARLLRKSGIFSKLEENPEFISKYYLIGDSAYPNLRWLVTPFTDTGNLTREQIEFNYRLSATRIVVENAFGLLKGRFRRLRKLDNTNMRLCCAIIMSACILHNICIDENDIIQVDETDFNQPSNESETYYYGKRQQQVFEFLYRNNK